MKPTPFNALAKLLDIFHISQTLISGVAIDSRQIKVGDLFFALPGERVDGHTFIQEAFLQGASGVVVNEDYQGELFGLPSLRVPNVLAALQELARKSLQKRSSLVVAITGSLGKTTTKEFTKALISSTYSVFAAPLSYNSQATVPLSILMAEGTEEVLILEMGMSEPGNIQNLLSIAPPDIAALTTVALQHVSHFPDGLEGICREKASIFAHPKTRLGIVNKEIPYCVESYACKKKSFSIAQREADYFLELIPKGVLVHPRGEPFFEIEMHLPLKVHYQNFLAAVAIARALDVPWDCIKEVAPLLKLPPMRFERVEKEGIVFINDAYNANPDSMKAALTALPEPAAGGKKIAVLGDMNALGGFSEKGHAEVVEIALQSVDILLCLGHRFQNAQGIECFESRSELEKRLKELAEPGDVVLLKGARVHALEQILHRFE